MSIRWWEKPNKLRTSNNQNSYVTEFGLSGVHKEYDARQIAFGLLPNLIITSMGIMQLGPVEVRLAGHLHWDITANYGPPNGPNFTGGPNLQPGQFTFNFDTMGGTRHIDNVGHVKGGAIVGSYGIGPAVVPDVKGTIGFNLAENRVDGCDVHSRGLKFQMTFCHPQGVVTMAFAKKLRNVSATCNDRQWGPFAAGEALFLGANGSDGTNADANVVYHFDSSENVQNLQVGDVVVVTKDGWDYAWTVHKGGKSADRPVLKPEFVYVARVYERKDFATELGFTPQ